jgi:hypothetical protein
MNKSRIQYELAVKFVSEFNLIFYQNIIHHLSSFIKDSFFKNLFEKNTLKSGDKVQLLIEKFGEVTNPSILFYKPDALEGFIRTLLTYKIGHPQA